MANTKMVGSRAAKVAEEKDIADEVNVDKCRRRGDVAKKRLWNSCAIERSRKQLRKNRRETSSCAGR